MTLSYARSREISREHAASEPIVDLDVIDEASDPYAGAGRQWYTAAQVAAIVDDFPYFLEEDEIDAMLDVNLRYENEYADWQDSRGY